MGMMSPQYCTVVIVTMGSPDTLLHQMHCAVAVVQYSVLYYRGGKRNEKERKGTL